MHLALHSHDMQHSELLFDMGAEPLANFESAAAVRCCKYLTSEAQPTAALSQLHLCATLRNSLSQHRQLYHSSWSLLIRDVWTDRKGGTQIRHKVPTKLTRSVWTSREHDIPPVESSQRPVHSSEYVLSSDSRA